MTTKELLAKLEDEINKLNSNLSSIPEDDYLERCITLGKINGLLTAKLIACNLEESELV